MRFSGKRIKGEKRSKPPQSQTRPSPPRYIAIGPREELLDEDGPEGASPGARTRQGRGRATPTASQAQLCRADSIDGGEDGVGVGSVNLAPGASSLTPI
jgi:hypothetical protein